MQKSGTRESERHSARVLEGFTGRLTTMRTASQITTIRGSYWGRATVVGGTAGAAGLHSRRRGAMAPNARARAVLAAG